MHGNPGYSVGMGMAAVITGCCLLFHEQQYEGIGCLTPFDALNNDAADQYKADREGAFMRKMQVKLTGSTHNARVGPAVWLKTPRRALESTQILGQPCEFPATQMMKERYAAPVDVEEWKLARVSSATLAKIDQAGKV